MIATGLGPQQLTTWLTPDEVDMTGEPSAFVRFGEGRRLLVLRWQADACQFLVDNRCAVHSSRPTSCRVYPFDVTFGKRNGIRRLKVLDMNGCEAAWDARGNTYEIVRTKQQELDELRSYHALVARFNRVQAHRARLKKPLLNDAQYFKRLVAASRDERCVRSETTSVHQT